MYPGEFILKVINSTINLGYRSYIMYRTLKDYVEQYTINTIKGVVRLA